MVVEHRCPTCGSEDVVDTGPLTVHSQRAKVTVASARQCTLCGNLELTVPQAVLLQLYPPGVRYLTRGRRARLKERRRMRRQLGI